MTEETQLYNNPIALLVNNVVVNILNFDDITYNHLKNNSKLVDLKGNIGAANIGDVYNSETRTFSPLDPNSPEAINIPIE